MSDTPFKLVVYDADTGLWIFTWPGIAGRRYNKGDVILDDSGNRYVVVEVRAESTETVHVITVRAVTDTS